MKPIMPDMETEDELPKSKWGFAKFIKELIEENQKNHLEAIENTVQKEVNQLFSTFKDKIRRKNDLNSEVLQSAFEELKDQVVLRVQNLEEDIRPIKRAISVIKWMIGIVFTGFVMAIWNWSFK